jgi:cell division topological specificity factor
VAPRSSHPLSDYCEEARTSNMNIFRSLFGRSTQKSSQLAKNRLKLVLVYDRVKITPQLMDTLKGELIDTISRHLDIDQEGVSVTITRGERTDRLVADIPIRRPR